MILSTTASLRRGASSGTIWDCGASGGNGATTSSTRSRCCQSIAVRSCATPASSTGSEMYRLKKIRSPARLARSSTSATRPTTSAPSASWLTMPTCMS